MPAENYSVSISPPCDLRDRRPSRYANRDGRHL